MRKKYGEVDDDCDALKFKRLSLSCLNFFIDKLKTSPLQMIFFKTSFLWPLSALNVKGLRRGALEVLAAYALMLSR